MECLHHPGIILGRARRYTARRRHPIELVVIILGPRKQNTKVAIILASSWAAVAAGCFARHHPSVILHIAASGARLLLFKGILAENLSAIILVLSWAFEHQASLCTQHPGLILGKVRATSSWYHPGGAGTNKVNIRRILIF